MNKLSLHNNRITLLQGNCFDWLPKIKANSIDMVFADLPYGTTACKWDSLLPLDRLWQYLNIIGKYNTTFAFTATQPFTTTLINSNIDYLKYALVWDKGRGNEPQMANIRPMKAHEDILIFCRDRTIYNPQKTLLLKPDIRAPRGTRVNRSDGKGQNLLASVNDYETTYNDRFPTSILYFENGNQRKKVHPTQKPIELLEYLIKTYTNENDVVLDPTMGSGTTTVACINTNRRCIGIELDEEYYKIAIKRCEEAITKCSVETSQS